MPEPHNQQRVSPYLTVNGAKKAAEWYKDIFGAKILHTMDAEDGERLMHASLDIGGSSIMLSDEFPEWSNFTGPQKDPISPVAISITLDRPEEVDGIYKTAMEAGATSLWPPEDMFWGDRFCQIIDPFNHRWMLVARLPDKG